MTEQTSTTRHTAAYRRLALSIPEAAERLGVSSQHAYRLARTGALPTVYLGGRRVVPVVQLARLLEGER